MWAKTGHTFQGQSARQGFVILCIIVQPGNKTMEGLCTRLLYMFLSEATDTGDEDDRTKSAIFFFTNDLNKEQIMNLTKRRIKQRCTQKKKWVKYLL